MLARMRKSMKEKDQGFTLIELLVVMIIIGILAAIAIPIFLNQRKKAVDASIKSDVKNAATAVESWIVDNPTSAISATAASSTTFGARITGTNVITVTGGGTSGTYCIKGSGDGSNAPATSAAVWFWYDSGAGGMKTGSPTALSGNAAVTGAACP